MENAKNSKMVNFWELRKTVSLRSDRVPRQVTFNRTKIGGKCQNSKIQNATFWMIFKHCALSIMVISRLTNSSNSLRRGQESSVVNKDFNENSPGTRSGPSKSSSQSKIR